MIVGSGLISNEFLKYEEYFYDCIIFASGVSSSTELNDESFQREFTLIKKCLLENKNLKLIYFSSILTDTINNSYYIHKKNIEEFIIENASQFIIYRIPQVIGFIGNENNIINFFKKSISSGSLVKIKDKTYRSILDVTDLVNIVKESKNNIHNRIIYLSGIQKISVLDLYLLMSDILNKPINFELIKSNNNENWDSCNDELIDKTIDTIGIDRKNYTNKLLNKYIK
jgi:nucleoside-diphosphate-sugar epimerase